MHEDRRAIISWGRGTLPAEDGRVGQGTWEMSRRRDAVIRYPDEGGFLPMMRTLLSTMGQLAARCLGNIGILAVAEAREQLAGAIRTQPAECSDGSHHDRGRGRLLPE